MATQTFKIPLNAANFPFITSDQSRAVMIPNVESGPRSGRAFSGTEDSTDYNQPQLLFCENVIPKADGIKSVSYKTVIQAAIPSTDDFDQIFPLRDAEENVVLLSPAKGKNYTYSEGSPWAANPMSGIWPTGYTVATTSVDTLETSIVSRAYADGKTFVAYSNILLDNGTLTLDGSIYFWDTSGTPELVLCNPFATPGTATDPIAGLPTSIKGNIQGITSSNGYLVIISGLTAYYAPFDGVQFNFAVTANGESTGAGSKIPEDIKGPITVATPISGGFILFSNKNAIAAVYSSSNFDNPFIFREISNCGGVEDPEKIAYDNAATAPPQRITAYTTGGLQEITLNTAQSLYPNASDFLGGKRMERYDSTLKKTVISNTSVEFFTKLTYIGNRFLVISYGTFPGVFSWALLYDASLQRWGKFRLVHVDCFPYLYNNETADLTYGMLLDVPYSDLMDVAYEDLTVAPTGVTYPLQAVGFLLKTGEVKLAVLDSSLKDPEDASTAVAIFGRIQFTRANRVSVINAEVDGLQSGGLLSVAASWDGRNLQDPVAGIITEQLGNYAKFGWELLTGKNFNFILEGDFNVATIVTEVMQDGKF